MKIDPTQTSLPGLNAAGRAKQTQVEAKNSFVALTGTATETLEKPANDTDKLKDSVKKLQSSPDIRPEVVAGRSAADPAKAPTDAQLANFIAALRNENF